MALALHVRRLLGDAPVAVDAYDGSHADPLDGPARATAIVRRPEAVRRVLARPGELGIARAFVAGDLEVEGDLFTVLDVGFRRGVRIDARSVVALAREVGTDGLRPIPPPPEEARLRGVLHSRTRDADAISHHYDVSNEFYRLVLGPSMTYSCAVFADDATTLERAQAAKHELVCRKLALHPDMRLLDVGCGWGSMLIHAAREHGVTGVGITISRRQAELAAKRVADAGLADRVEIRLQDYRDVPDQPFDAISSIGMFEHVGRRQLETYVRTLFGLLRPGGRLLNHAIGRPGYPQPATPAGRLRALNRRVATAVGASWPSRIDSALMDRYVFPDGELHEVGTVVSMLQEAGFEVRHLESLREHYALTLRAWVANLEQAWDEAVREVGEGRARVWRLYMAACALGFEHGSTQVHQVLAVAPDDGRSGMPLRPCF
ncbi:MAG: cyclopropane-fatty-acyl-phospholipid synthase family protein [Acidimicrobiales bacterium]